MVFQAAKQPTDSLWTILPQCHGVKRLIVTLCD